MLATRFRPLPVFLWVIAGFGAHVVIVVAAGSLLSLLPRQWVALGVAMLFRIGAVLLWRSADEGVEETEGDTTPHRE